MRLIYVIIAILALFGQGITTHAANDNSTDSVFKQANTAYHEKNYPQAIALYNQLLDEGFKKSTVHYNLANAYFKDHQLGLAILHYEKALKLNPANDDYKHNLDFANSQRKDKMEAAPELFFKRCLVDVGNLFSVNGWAIGIVGCAVLFVVGVVCWMLFRLPKAKVCSFVVSVLFLITGILCAVFTFRQYQQTNNSKEAIVIVASVVVKSTPDISGTDLFIVHEGMKVEIVEASGEWLEVRFVNMEKGWIPKHSVEKITN